MSSGDARSHDEPIRSPAASDGGAEPRELGALWHGVGGLAIGALAALFGGIAAAGATLALAVVGWAREVLQHDLWLSARQWLEAMAWPIGGVVGAGISLGAQALL